MAALQTKVGANGSGVTSTLDYKVAQLVAAVLPANAQFRLQNGELQIWDAGYQQYVTLVCNYGVLGTAAPGQ